MKKLVTILLFLVAFAFSADYKPFTFGNIPNNDSAQQTEFEYMLQYKLWGTDYIQMGHNIKIPDKSGWNGSRGTISSDGNGQIVLGGPVLTTGNINMGMDSKFTTGPVRANTFNSGVRGEYAGNICLVNKDGSNVNGTFSCDSVPDASNTLKMPTIVWPTDGYQDDIILTENNQADTIYVPEGEGQYDVYFKNIWTCVGGRNGCKIYVKMEKNRLTRIFVDSLFIGNHTTISVILGDEVLPQNKYKGNVLIYSNKDIIFDNTDNVPIQGSFITTSKIYLKCNLDFAGQLLANQLEIGNDFKGENFRFVKYDPDTLDFPELNKQGGLKENDSTVIIPISLSDTATIDVYFTYCFELKDGVTVEDFNMPPYLPICGDSSVTTKIPIGQKSPLDTIKINVKVDDLTEPNDILVMKIDSITGAVLPNGETSGELKIKIIDAPTQNKVAFDTTKTYSFEENKTGLVDTIAVLNKKATTRFILDSAYTDRYVLDSITGKLTIVGNPLDYEWTAVDVIKVTLKDTGDVVVTGYIPITVIDVNEAPVLNDTTFTLSENVPIPSIVGTLVAKDEDIKASFKQNQFELLAGNSNFAVDKTSGRITATKIFNYETDSTTYKLTVRVYDKNDPTLSDTATVTIRIGNLNDGPKFATEDTTLFINENTPAGIIGKVAAVDEDGDGITYTIIGNVPFTVDNQGNISSTRPFDYEAETGFVFKMVASDGTATDTVKVTVKVNNVNEACTVEDTTFSIKENATGKIGNVDAKDLDKDAIFGTIHYSIDDTVNYQVDKDGNVFVKNPFNYEDTQYDTVKVFITDGTFKDTATVIVTVINIPEDIVVTGQIEDVKENSELGTPVGVITGIDGDSTTVTYTINTTDFSIDPVTGVIVTNSNIDYETQSEYPVTVTATSTDGSKKDTSFVIHVLDVDEPVHARDTSFTVPENKTGEIGKVEGYDEDGKPVKYDCDDTVHYSIDPNTGVVGLVTPFDYETTKFDTLLVYVTDVNGNRDMATVIITVKNVNENPELLPNDSLIVPENCKNCEVGIITAVDPDSDPITFTVKEPGFEIDSNGVLTVTKPLDYETTPGVKITVIATDPSGAGDTATYIIKVTDVNEPVHVQDTTCTVKENYTGNVCKIPATDEDKTTPKYILTDTTDYSIDSTGQLVIKNPVDFEKKQKDTVTVIVTDGEFYDTAQVIIRVLDEPEIPEITEVDDQPKVDTLKTNNPDHTIDYKICEGDDCAPGHLDVVVHKDTVVKVCNIKKTLCDSVVILFNDVPPVVTLTNAKSTEALIDYITIEEQKDDKIYVNKKDNEIVVTVKDTVRNTTKKFEIDVKLDTIPTKDIKIKEYSYLIDETTAKVTPIGNNKAEVRDVITVDGIEVIITKIIDTKTGEPVDSVQTVTYTKKVDGKEVTVSYRIDDLTGQKVSDYEVSYMIDSCTKVSYAVNSDNKIVKNEEGNIAYNITYDYTDDFGNKASATVEIIYDDIPPVVEILSPYEMDHFKTSAIPVKWTVNGDVQDTLTLQRLERGVNYIVRRYVDKAGNVATDTIKVIMTEAKDIDISLVHPVTEVDMDKVNEYYSDGHKYDKKKPYDIKFVDPKNDTLPDVVGVGFKVDLVLPSVSPTGSLATLDDIVKNGQIPIDDKGNIVGASTKGIPVEQYVNEHCTEEFQDDYKKNGLNIPLYDVSYKLSLWVYTTTAGYVNDFDVKFTVNDEAKTTTAGTVQMVIDWIADKDGHVKAYNGHGLGTSAYITKLFSYSEAKHRCDYKDQKKGEKTVKRDETLKIFGYKRPNDK